MSRKRTRKHVDAAEPSGSKGPSSRRAFLADLGLSALSGAMVWAAFPPADAGMMAWIALVPWLLVLARAPTRRALLVSGIVAYALYVALLYWLGHVTTLGWLMLAVYCAAYWPAAAVLVRWLRRKGVPFALSVPLTLAVWEFTRAHALTGFPFLFLAHTQHRFLTVIQIADLGGVYTLSLLIGLVNGALADLILDRFRPTRWNALRVGAAVLLVGAALVYGRTRLRVVERLTAEAPTRRVAIVQANIPIDLKVSPDIAQVLQNLDRHVVLSRQAAAHRPELVIWAETVLPAALNLAYDDEVMAFLREKNTNSDYVRLLNASRSAVEQACRDTGAHLLLGSASFDIAPRKHFNSAYFLSPSAEILGRYDKNHLVVFGEYTPLVDTFPFLAGLRPAVMGEDLTPGRTRRLMEWPARDGASRRFGVVICYEDSVADLFSRFVRDGADFMVNITNDGWFRDSTELDVHVAVCAFRAVENRISIARCANTGVSAVIAPSGRLLSQIQDASGKRRAVEGVLIADLPIVRAPSLYTRFGDAFAWLCVAGLGILCVAAWRRTGAPRKSKAAA